MLYSYNHTILDLSLRTRLTIHTSKLSQQSNKSTHGSPTKNRGLHHEFKQNHEIIQLYSFGLT